MIVIPMLQRDLNLLKLCLDCASLSKDPDTKVGCVIINHDGVICSWGFNSFPEGIAETEERLNNRELKLKLMVHAEMNAITKAARHGKSLKNSKLYLAATDATGKVWGGPPCTRCLVHVIPAGITEIVSLPQKPITKWADDLQLSRSLIAERNLTYSEMDYATHECLSTNCVDG